jgi:hypothetical protein
VTRNFHPAFLGLIDRLVDPSTLTPEPPHTVEDQLTAEILGFRPSGASVTVDAVAFLELLDTIDQQHARGEIDDAAHRLALCVTHQAVPMPTWMRATQIAGMALRLASRERDVRPRA